LGTLICYGGIEKEIGPDAEAPRPLELPRRMVERLTESIKLIEMVQAGSAKKRTVNGLLQFAGFHLLIRRSTRLTRIAIETINFDYKPETCRLER